MTEQPEEPQRFTMKDAAWAQHDGEQSPAVVPDPNAAKRATINKFIPRIAGAVVLFTGGALLGGDWAAFSVAAAVLCAVGLLALLAVKSTLT